MNSFMEQITPALIQMAVVIITTLAGYIGIKIKSAYTTKVNTDVKKSVVESTVAYVEQVFKDLHGQEKFDKSKEEIVKLLNAKGVPINLDEINVLIEAAVYSFNEPWRIEKIIDEQEREEA